VSTSFATRTSSADAPEGWPWRAPYRHSFLLSLAGVSLAVVNVVLLRAAWALGTGPSAWQAHLEQLSSRSVLALHALLVAIACGFAWGFVARLARLAGPRVRSVLACGSIALIASAVLIGLLLAGACA
jgi:hypothetical protein